MFSGYSLAWHVPRALRDGRQRTISAKRPPSKTPQTPRQQPPAGRCGSSEGKTVASRREPSEARADPLRVRNIVQLARSRLLRLAFCTCNRGLMESWHLTRPGLFCSWLNRKCEASDCRQGGCESFAGDFTERDSLPSHRGAPLAQHTLKDTAQTRTRTKRKNT